VVISCPSKGPNNQFIGSNLAGGMKAQVRDLEFLLQEVLKLSFIDSSKIATAGFSFGGLSNVLFQTRNEYIKAILSLDGTIRYNYNVLKETPEYSVEKVDVPFLHMAQKAIPEAIMKRENMDAKLNTEFLFYDELTNSHAYKFRFHDLTHMNFSAFDIVLRNRDQEQDKSETLILQSYRLVAEYSLQFLNAYLKKDTNALQYLQKKEPEVLISKEFKTSKKQPYTFHEFHGLVKKQEYKNITQLYAQVQKEHPNFKINEGWLNKLGLQLIFNPETAEAGIAIYNFALSLFPTSANLYDSLATGYFYLGQKEEAIQNFKKSLELYPQNGHAKEKLKLLNKN
jgi:tetratricopeptide (TPR) repeat protein